MHPGVPGNGTHDHPLRLPAFCYIGKQALCKAADMVALLTGRAEGGKHFFFKGETFHHFTSSRSSYKGPRGVSVLFLSFIP